MPTVFISYRRSDSADVSGRIYDRLVAKFGREMVFKDVDSIPLGTAFKNHIISKIKKIDCVLVVVGSRWAEPLELRRLHDPDDYVRMEIETALSLDIPTIPLMVGGAKPPSIDVLPESLKPLFLRNGLEVRADPDFHKDMDRLISRLPASQISTIGQPASIGPNRRTESSQAVRRIRILAWLSAAIFFPILAVLKLMPYFHQIRGEATPSERSSSGLEERHNAAVSPNPDPSPAQLAQLSASTLPRPKDFAACATCHGSYGQGANGMPGLWNEPVVSGSVDTLIRILLRGMRPIPPNNSGMPAMSDLSNEQIAEILTYIRASFGNSAPAVTSGEVEILRSEVGLPPLSRDEVLKK